LAREKIPSVRIATKPRYMYTAAKIGRFISLKSPQSWGRGAKTAVIRTYADEYKLATWGGAPLQETRDENRSVARSIKL
jgi:hypothetical protein